MPETAALPGTEIEAIQELTDAARQLKVIRKERMALTKQEVEAAEKVLALMHAHKLETYKDTNFDPPVECSIVQGKEKVKVKGVKDEESEED